MISSIVKWESIEPEPNVFDFTGADEIVQFAESVNAMVQQTVSKFGRIDYSVNSAGVS